MPPTMPDNLDEDLPLVQRLALSYAPAAARHHMVTLLALDARLAGILRQQSETIITQIKFAWWRDRLTEDRAKLPGGEPLLARLSTWPGDTRALVPLVDGWEAMLAETLDQQAIEDFASGRAGGWAALSGSLAASDAGPEAERTAREWAIADLALHLGPGEERDAATSFARSLPWRAARLPRALRPLAVLHGLAKRALARGSGELLDGPGAMLVALRIGASGR